MRMNELKTIEKSVVSNKKQYSTDILNIQKFMTENLKSKVYV